MMAGRKTTVIVEPDADADGDTPRRGRPPKAREQTNTILSMSDLSEMLDVLDSAASGGSNPRIALYREDRSGSNTIYLFLDDLECCPQSYTQIGEKYGGGRLRIYARWKTDDGVWHVIMHNFALSPRFDVIAKANASRSGDDSSLTSMLPVGTPPRPVEHPAQALAVRPVEPQRNGMAETLAVIREIAAVMAPLLKPQRDPMEMLSMIAGMGQEMFKRSLSQADEYGRRVMDMVDARAGIETEPEDIPPPEDVAPKDPVIAMMLEALKTIVPMFRAVPDAVARGAAQPIAARPDVKALLTDVKRRRRMMFELRQVYPEREVERLCRVFGVPYKAPEPTEIAVERVPAATDDGPSTKEVQPFVQTDLFRREDAPQGDQAPQGAAAAGSE
jgi:hypothetical protein